MIGIGIFILILHTCAAASDALVQNPDIDNLIIFRSTPVNITVEHGDINYFYWRIETTADGRVTLNDDTLQDFPGLRIIECGNLTTLEITPEFWQTRNSATVSCETSEVTNPYLLLICTNVLISTDIEPTTVYSITNEVNTFNISWIAPPHRDITDYEPDVWYHYILHNAHTQEVICCGINYFETSISCPFPTQFINNHAYQFAIVTENGDGLARYPKVKRFYGFTTVPIPQGSNYRFMNSTEIYNLAKQCVESGEYPAPEPQTLPVFNLNTPTCTIEPTIETTTATAAATTTIGGTLIGIYRCIVKN